MDYEQLQDGTWQRNPGPQDKPQPVRIWYMRDERDAGYTYGMLCGKPEGVVRGVVHARTAAEWPAFEDAARPWLETAVARSKPPNVRAKRSQTAPQE